MDIHRTASTTAGVTKAVSGTELGPGVRHGDGILVGDGGDGRYDLDISSRAAIGVVLVSATEEKESRVDQVVLVLTAGFPTKVYSS